MGREIRKLPFFSSIPATEKFFDYGRHITPLHRRIFASHSFEAHFMIEKSRLLFVWDG